MNTGHVISAAGHAALIGWVILGGVFHPEQKPFEVSDVAIISSEAFAALNAAQQPPEVANEVMQPALPDGEGSSAPSQESPVDAPTPPRDQDLPEAPSAPAPEVALPAPDINDRPVPRPSERIAPVPAVKPQEKARPDPVTQEAVKESTTAITPAREQEATAPQEAADEIVTEAEKPSGGLKTSLRPPARRPERPVAPAPAPKPAPKPEPKPDPANTGAADTADAINDALAQALGQSEEAAPPSGPPLSAGEKEALRVSVQRCWNVGSLSSAALATTVIVGVSLGRDGKPVVSSIRMIGSEGGTQSSVKQAYETARRAIIRCGARGFQLPIEKYEQWKDIEMSFNPERMRIK